MSEINIKIKKTKFDAVYITATVQESNGNNSIYSTCEHSNNPDFYTLLLSNVHSLLELEKIIKNFGVIEFKTVKRKVIKINLAEYSGVSLALSDSDDED